LENLQSSAVLPLEHRGSVIDAHPRFKAWFPNARFRDSASTALHYMNKSRSAKSPLGSCLSKETRRANKKKKE